jgi:RNA polymerase sigma factor (sigma-70 family)
VIALNICHVPALHHAPGPRLPKPKDDPRIAQYLPLCKSLARQYLRKMGGQLELDDLVSICQAAIWRATLTHREDGGAAFGTYAYRAAVNAMEREQFQIWTVIVRRVWLNQQPITGTNSDGEEFEIALPNGGPSPESIASARQLAAALVGCAEGRNQDLLRRLYGFDETFGEAGEEFGLTRERVRQIEAATVARLKRRLEIEMKVTRREQVRKSTARANSNLDDPDRPGHNSPRPRATLTPATTRGRVVSRNRRRP